MLFKKSTFIFFIQLFLLFISFNLSTQAIPEDISGLLGGHVLKVGTIGNIPPFSFYDKEIDEYQGIDMEICKLFVEQHYVKVEFIPTDYSTMIDELTKEKFHMIMGGIPKNIFLGENQEEENHIKFSRTYLKTGRALVMRKKDIEEYEINSFDKANKKGFKVLVDKKSQNEKFAQELLGETEIEFVNKENNYNKIKNILMGADDILVCDYYEGLYYAGIYDELDLVVVDESDEDKKEELVAVFREGDDALVNWFDLELESLEIDGTIDELVNDFVQSIK